MIVGSLASAFIRVVDWAGVSWLILADGCVFNGARECSKRYICPDTFEVGARREKKIRFSNTGGRYGNSADLMCRLCLIDLFDGGVAL